MGSKINVFNVFDFLIISTYMYMYMYLTFHYTQLTKIKDFNVFFNFNFMIRTYMHITYYYIQLTNMYTYIHVSHDCFRFKINIQNIDKLYQCISNIANAKRGHIQECRSIGNLCQLK